MMITSTTEYTSMRYAENARSNSGKIVRPTAATMEPVSEPIPPNTTMIT